MDEDKGQEQVKLGGSAMIALVDERCGLLAAAWNGMGEIAVRRACWQDGFAARVTPEEDLSGELLETQAALNEARKQADIARAAVTAERDRADAFSSALGRANDRIGELESKRAVLEPGNGGGA